MSKKAPFSSAAGIESSRARGDRPFSFDPGPPRVARGPAGSRAARPGPGRPGDHREHLASFAISDGLADHNLAAAADGQAPLLRLREHHNANKQGDDDNEAEQDEGGYGPRGDHLLLSLHP